MNRCLKTINSKKYGVDRVSFTSHPTTVIYSSKNGWDGKSPLLFQLSDSVSLCSIINVSVSPLCSQNLSDFFLCMTTSICDTLKVIMIGLKIFPAGATLQLPCHNIYCL